MKEPDKGHELFSYDEENGFQLIKDIYVGNYSSDPHNFCIYNNKSKMYFGSELSLEQ